MAHPKSRVRLGAPAVTGPGEAPQRFDLRLYVAGATVRSLRAVANLKAICEQHLKDRYRLSVVDVYQYPELARLDQIVAVPTLVKRLPEPLRLLVGDLSRTEQVLQGLGLAARAA